VYRIILHSGSMLGRGDATNALNMAEMIADHLNGVSLVTVPENRKLVDAEVVKALRDVGLKVVVYRDSRDLQQTARRFQVTHAYFMKSGLYDGCYVEGTPSFVHAVFRDYQPHGEVYAFASKWLLTNVKSKPHWLKWYRHYPRHVLIKVKSGSPYFPARDRSITWMGHPVFAPQPGTVSKNVRDEYGIPRTSKLILRIGGRYDFNDEAGKSAVEKVLEQSTGIHFVFVNTEPFLYHPRVVYVNKYISKNEKDNLISSSDLLLNCRLRGESFGYQICEGLSYGKPCLAPALCRNPQMDGHHIDLLTDKQFLYEDSQDLIEKIFSILDTPPDCDFLKAKVTQFNYENTAKRFHEIFLSKF
jgi:hypothetical protein